MWVLSLLHSTVKTKVLSRATLAHRDSADLRFCGPQPNASRSCRTMYTGPMCRMVVVVVGCRGRQISQHELRPSVGPLLNPYPHNGVCVCVCISTRPRCPNMHVHVRVLWAVFVQFILVRWPHCASCPQHWPSRLNRPIQAGESVDQWSRVSTGTVVEQIAPIAAVMNATSVHSLPRTTPNPLSCLGLTPCVSLQSPEPFLVSHDVPVYFPAYALLCLISVLIHFAVYSAKLSKWHD